MKRGFLVASILFFVVSSFAGCPPPPPPRPPPPEITSLSLWRAAPGTEVEISGEGFFFEAQNNVVMFGDFVAPVVYSSPERLKILVPPVHPLPTLEPEAVGLTVLTPAGISPIVSFKVLPLSPPATPGVKTRDVLELLDSLLERLSKEREAEGLFESIEQAKGSLSEANELVESIEKEHLQAIDGVFSNARLEERLDEVIQDLRGTPDISRQSILLAIQAVAKISADVILLASVPPVGLIYTMSLAVVSASMVTLAWYSITQDLEKQKR